VLINKNEWPAFPALRFRLGTPGYEVGSLERARLRMIDEAADKSDVSAQEDPIVHVPTELLVTERDTDRSGHPRPFECDHIIDAGSPQDNDYPGRDETTGGGDPSDPVRSLPQEHADGLGKAADRGQEWH
jgi:hypothetical protein